MKLTLRQCSKCKKDKDVSEFYRYRKDKGLMRCCKDCCSASSSARYAENSDSSKKYNKTYYAKNKDRIQENRRAARKTNLRTKLSICSSNCKSRADTKGWSFDLDVEFLLDMFIRQNGLCYYTGKDLTLTGKNKVSVDRKDPSRGYTKDNVNLVCLAINYMKRDLSHEEFLDMCKIIGERF